MDAMPQLVERDSSATAGIILSSFPQEHAAAVRQLQGSPHLQYKYLKAALQVKIPVCMQRQDPSTACTAEIQLLTQYQGNPWYQDTLCT